MLDLPLYMRTQPEEFYKSFMEDRKIFSTFMQTHIRPDVDDILQNINQYINNKYPAQVAVWVGGVGLGIRHSNATTIPQK